MTPKSVVWRAIGTMGGWCNRQICSREFKEQTFSHHNERPIEYCFALQVLAKQTPVSVLDVGSGTTAWPRLLRDCGFVVTAIDNVTDYCPAGMNNRHWSVLDVNIVQPDGKLQQSFDAITCISVLEHIEDQLPAVRNMASLLKPGGALVLTTPFSYYNPHPNVYTHAEALYRKDLPYTCRSSSSAELKQWLGCGLTLENRELWRLFSGPVWATGERVDGKQAQEDEPHQLGCFHLRKKA